MDGVLSATTDSEVSPKGLYRDHFVKPRLLETAATLAVTPHPWKRCGPVQAAEQDTGEANAIG